MNKKELENALKVLTTIDQIGLDNVASDLETSCSIYYVPSHTIDDVELDKIPFGELDGDGNGMQEVMWVYREPATKGEMNHQHWFHSPTRDFDISLILPSVMASCVMKNVHDKSTLRMGRMDVLEALENIDAEFDLGSMLKVTSTDDSAIDAALYNEGRCRTVIKDMLCEMATLSEPRSIGSLRDTRDVMADATKVLGKATPPQGGKTTADDREQRG